MHSRMTGVLGTTGLILFLAAGVLFSPESYAFFNPWSQEQPQSRLNDEEDAASRVSAEEPPRDTTADASKKKKSSGYILGKVKEWREASLDHIPGKPDPAATTIGKWSSGDLEIVVDFITKLASRSKKSIRRTLAATPVRTRLRLTDEEVQKGDLNRLLKQGALLHTDIALLNLQRGAGFDSEDLLGAFIDGRGFLTPRVIHWELARRLINSISPSPSGDPAARQWYIATTAAMQRLRRLVYAGENLKSALEIFPSDGRILLYAGALHETLALPVNQNVQMPSLRQISYGSEKAELKQARNYYQDDVAVNPDFGEARLRLGRVQGLLGRHEEAVEELEKAEALIRDPMLSYYASLFLGRELEMSSLPERAREQYERAATLYPSAQSPKLALSQLAYLNNDAQAAMRRLEEVFALAPHDPWRDDPFWTYELSHVRDAAALLDAMYRMIGGLPR